MKDDGSLDLEASARKNAEAYTGLEKRLGSGGAPPASPGEYQIAAPEALKDAFQPEDPGFKKFLTAAHGVAMTQKQIDVTMGAFFEWAPKLIGAQQELDAEACVTQLQEVWTDPAALKQNFVGADRALKAYAGERYEKLALKFGNDPDAVWLLANIGKELKEDTTVDAQGAASADDIKALEASDAYLNAKHPEHAAVSARVRAWYQARSK
jgi:hypothetical protein